MDFALSWVYVKRVFIKTHLRGSNPLETGLSDKVCLKVLFDCFQELRQETNVFVFSMK